MSKIKEILESQAGGILVLFVLALLFYPLVWRNDPKGWEAMWFILGGLTTILKDKILPPKPPVN